MSKYPVVDLSNDAATVAIASKGEVDIDALRDQLTEIRDALSPLVASATPAGGIQLSSLELSLTVGAEGGVWFVAKGSIEASITMTFSRAPVPSR